MREDNKFFSWKSILEPLPVPKLLIKISILILLLFNFLNLKFGYIKSTSQKTIFESIFL